MIKFLLFLAFAWPSLLVDSCVIDEFLRVRELATKTPYEYLYNNHSELPKEFKGYKVEKFWLVSRHGTRYPSKSGIKFITNALPLLLEKAEGSLCPNDLRLLKAWQNSVADMTEDMAKRLHPEGEKELILMAERWQRRFPNILGENYEPTRFRFRATNTQRAQESQRSFAVGLFNRTTAYKVQYERPIEPHDPVIRFYKVCPRWQAEVKKNPHTLVEQKNLQESVAFSSQIIRPLKDILGQELSLESIDAMWVACSFGQAWHPNKLSPWCGLFNATQLQLLAYREDLEYFYEDSYGNSLNSQQACVLMQDVLANFDNSVMHNSTLYFTHSGAILKFLAYLNYTKPDGHFQPKFDSDFEAMMKEWTTSKTDSFASNVAFVKASSSNSNIYYVGMFVNEHFTEIPGCGGQLWCPFETFETIFKSCDFHALCHLDNYNHTHGSEDDRY